MENIQDKINLTKTTPPYKLGYLGLFPLIGFFVGIGLTLYGIFRYKDRKLTVIGIACMLFTVLAYSALFYVGFSSDTGKKSWGKIAQFQLNQLVKDIEYYKLQKGNYPDSLKQMEKPNVVTYTEDPTQSELKNSQYNYKKIGEKYMLFSSGSDRTQNTVDDIYPEIENLKTVGWVKKSNNR